MVEQYQMSNSVSLHSQCLLFQHMVLLAPRGESCQAQVFLGIWQTETRLAGWDSGELRSSECDSARTPADRVGR